MKYLELIRTIHDITISFFKVCIYFIYGYFLFFLGLINRKFWGEKIIVTFDRSNKGNIPNIKRLYWSHYKNLEKSNTIISKNKYNFTYFLFICVFTYLIIRFSLMDIIRLIFNL